MQRFRNSWHVELALPHITFAYTYYMLSLFLKRKLFPAK